MNAIVSASVLVLLLVLLSLAGVWIEDAMLWHARMRRRLADLESDRGVDAAPARSAASPRPTFSDTLPASRTLADDTLPFNAAAGSGALAQELTGLVAQREGGVLMHDEFVAAKQQAIERWRGRARMSRTS